MNQSHAKEIARSVFNYRDLVVISGSAFDQYVASSLE